MDTSSSGVPASHSLRTLQLESAASRGLTAAEYSTLSESRSKRVTYPKLLATDSREHDT